MIKNKLIDGIICVLLIGISLWFCSFLLTANYIDPQYPDWLIQAFRIRNILDNGLASWSHTWSNGISLWGSYQFIPHLLTILLIKLTGMSITSAMISMQVGLFALLRVVIYLVLRKLNHSRLTSIFISLISLSISQIWSGVSEFTNQFGTFVIPFLYYLWVKDVQNPNNLSKTAVVSGLLWYIHPLSAIYGFCLWILRSIINKKLLSKKIIFELATFVSSSSLFLSHIVFSKGIVTNPFFLSPRFVSEGINQYSFFGIGIIILSISVISFIYYLFSKENSNQLVPKAGLIFSFLCLLFIKISSLISIPDFISQTQFFRGMSILAIVMILSTSSFIEKIIKSRNNFLNSLLLVSISISIVISHDSNSPRYLLTPNKIIDPVNEGIRTELITSSDSRIWTDELSLGSYLSPKSMRFPNSYMGHSDSNYASYRINEELLYPKTNSFTKQNYDWFTSYTKYLGIEYFIFSINSPYNDLLKNYGQDDYLFKGSVDANKSYKVYKTNFNIINAALLDDRFYPDDFVLGEVNLKDNNSLEEIDNLVLRTSKIIYAKERSIPVNVTYPSSETIQINIPINSSGYVYLNESFSRNWNAYIGDTKLNIYPFSANSILIDLRNVDTSTGIINLVHEWSKAIYLGIFFTIWSPVSFFIYQSILKKNASN